MSTRDKDRPYTVVVEGNIGSGKTTLLQHLAGAHHPHAVVEAFQEPVTKWRDVRGHNTLGLMYDDPQRWSLTFQTYVQLTMMELHERKTVDPKAVKMMERSIYSAKYCFVENLRINGTMPEVEYAVLTEWFDWLISRQSCDVDLIVYLRTDPEVVFDRIKKRCRNEEMTIPLDYLRCLHRLHERWLNPRGAVEENDADEFAASYPVPAPVLIIDGNCSADQMVHLIEREKMRILGGGGKERETVGEKDASEESRTKLRKVTDSSADEEEEETEDSQNLLRIPSQKRLSVDEEEDRIKKGKILKVVN